MYISLFLLIKCESVSDMKKDQTGVEKGDINKICIYIKNYFIVLFFLLFSYFFPINHFEQLTKVIQIRKSTFSVFLHMTEYLLLCQFYPNTFLSILSHLVL